MWAFHQGLRIWPDPVLWGFWRKFEVAYSSRILRQLARPSGFVGRLILRRLNRVNRGMNEAAYAALDPGDGDRVLEIGFGGGSLVGSILKNDGVAFVAGSDISSLAVQSARKRFACDIAAGRAEFRDGGEAILPFDDAGFSAVCCVNVIYFWPDVPAMLAEAFRVLKPEGIFALVYAEGAPDSVSTFPAPDVEAMLLDAGFDTATTSHNSDRENGRYHCTVARKPPALKLVFENPDQ